MGFLAGKKILITGLLSNKSIAYGIAKAMHREGAELAFTYVGQFKDRVEKLCAEFNPAAVLPCDVISDQEIKDLFVELGKVWDGLDAIVHSIAFAPRDQLEGNFIDCVTREGFSIAHDISAYSFAALAKEGRSMMKNRNASMVALTYIGAEKAMPSYNTMGVAKASLEATVRYTALALGEDGIKVNAVSAGPIKTLAASGISNFKKMLDYNAMVSPLKKNVDIMEVGNTVAFLCSDMATGITGEVVHVDAGYHCVSMGNVL
ncbi:enoyl-ACP reductase FabI [Francisella tularensis]|uniref:Enoyl-[acyl-carrier-protein] reductase [NADH] n=4 Tax=Francisella tularensis TaxID=263 RepID=Q5NGQ3_FRATT|nr:enoyl-ACP reductase [Francisella tularensis]AAV28899.1 NT02FT0335 [synthetic construct]ACD30963.1 enoyl-ACP reductase I [Francisella tularensis subsp. mediasiatica FSC147]ABO46487.1 enoyl-(acyl-carrier-protein) reductase [Francisella tularensis subsp. tularensis WY96-3418]ADA78469.1 enoyl-(acyl-carrier-protein) reductase [Francisella tularensis subsp. tularensis NE061598]AFB78894.1 Enoyl-(acyl-carrier-protein) reductase (NADH) [Francisella tularensis subsp. tularensis TIGB03]